MNFNSIKIHKPFHLQSNIDISTIKSASILQSNLCPNIQANADSIITASLIRSIKNNNAISKIVSDISYRLILFFIPNGKLLTDYDDLCINLTSYDQIVVACKFDQSNDNSQLQNNIVSHECNYNRFPKFLNELLSCIRRDFLITNRLRLLFNGIVVIGHLETCDIINNLIKNKIFNRSDKFKIVFLDPLADRNCNVVSDSVVTLYSNQFLKNTNDVNVASPTIEYCDIVSNNIMNAISDF